jgi:uncharacterized protein
MITTWANYDWWTIVLAAAAGLACGFLNTVASSGSAVSLPLLIWIGLDPLTANATNRIPVLLGAITATLSFHRKGAIRWRLVLMITVPVVLGSMFGALLALMIPGRDLGLVITAAVLIALVLIFTKLKQVIGSATVHDVRFGPREFATFCLIGGWLGFIVLDGSTYLLLALTLMLGLPLINANAIKSALLVPTTVIAMAVFAYEGHLNITLGIVMGTGSMAGGLLGARLAISPVGNVWIYRLLVTVILLELVHLAVHFVFRTHVAPGSFDRLRL